MIKSLIFMPKWTLYSSFSFLNFDYFDSSTKTVFEEIIIVFGVCITIGAAVSIIFINYK